MTSIERKIYEIYETDGYDAAVKYFDSIGEDLKKLAENETVKIKTTFARLCTVNGDFEKAKSIMQCEESRKSEDEKGQKKILGMDFVKVADDGHAFWISKQCLTVDMAHKLGAGASIYTENIKDIYYVGYDSGFVERFDRIYNSYSYYSGHLLDQLICIRLPTQYEWEIAYKNSKNLKIDKMDDYWNITCGPDRNGWRRMYRGKEGDIISDTWKHGRRYGYYTGSDADAPIAIRLVYEEKQ